ncbi:hypothetical protein BZG36_04111 [Bifiguratus adelaidae]|uniref:Uncharacterized protein n=1 Tax=Bifiguratus adelaidae TaxID=1938954 RepID=A0A261XX19_9FUNG|nr:hypothetical protein BZG36_04111 [Bifiguratus adelaidae]
MSDHAKLLREGKDGLLEHVTTDGPSNQQVVGSIIQIAGTIAYLMTIHLVAPALYVALHRGSVHIPATINEIPKFITSAKNLVWFATTSGRNLKRKSPSGWRGNTTHTTRQKNEKSQIPRGSGERQAVDILQLIVQSQKATEETSEDGQADEFGWIKRGAQWYNIYAKKTYNESPILGTFTLYRYLYVIKPGRSFSVGYTPLFRTFLLHY